MQMGILFKPLSKVLWKQIDDEVHACFQAGTERPTVAAVLYHIRSHKFLLITSTSGGLLNPGLVKGGVKKGESALCALIREIRQELRVRILEKHIKGYAGSFSVASVHQKDGRSTKRYFVFLVAYGGPHKLNINGELSGYFWYLLEEIPEVLGISQEARPRKYEVLMQIFASPSLKKAKAKRKKKITGR